MTETAPWRTRYTVDENGCWVWDGCTDARGYGQVRVDGRKLRSHRAFWIEANGEVPEGFELHHTCENKTCVRLDHLELVGISAHRRAHNKKRFARPGAEMRGAAWHEDTQRWAARFRDGDGKDHHLGVYDTQAEAALVAANFRHERELERLNEIARELYEALQDARAHKVPWNHDPTRARSLNALARYEREVGEQSWMEAEGPENG